MREEILAMFQVSTTDIYPDNDTWILDGDLYPEEIFGSLYSAYCKALDDEFPVPPDLKLVSCHGGEKV